MTDISNLLVQVLHAFGIGLPTSVRNGTCRHGTVHFRHRRCCVVSFGALQPRMTAVICFASAAAKLLIWCPDYSCIAVLLQHVLLVLAWFQDLSCIAHHRLADSSCAHPCLNTRLHALQRCLARAAAPAPALRPAEAGAGAAAQQGAAQPAQPAAAVRLPVQLPGPGRPAGHAGPQRHLHPGHQTRLRVPPLLCQALCSLAGQIHRCLPRAVYPAWVLYWHGYCVSRMVNVLRASCDSKKIFTAVDTGTMLCCALVTEVDLLRIYLPMQHCKRAPLIQKCDGFCKSLQSAACHQQVYLQASISRKHLSFVGMGHVIA